MLDQDIGRGGEIKKRGNTVVRPLKPCSASVHLLLNHLQQKGVENCPQLVAIEGDDSEVLTFVAGDCYDYPLRGAIASEQALISAATLLRRLHDASADFLNLHSEHCLNWMLPAREPQQVICHGDYSPYNVALEGDTVCGVFDFDTAHPAPRVWDIAYAVYCFAPFKTDPVDRLGDLAQQMQRARVFCDAYGVTTEDREQLVVTMIARLQALIDFIYQQAEQGNQQFDENLRDGHHVAYQKDIDYLLLNQSLITESLVG